MTTNMEKNFPLTVMLALGCTFLIFLGGGVELA